MKTIRFILAVGVLSSFILSGCNEDVSDLNVDKIEDLTHQEFQENNGSGGGDNPPPGGG